LRQAKRLQPDLITMDIEMPGINGLDAVREIRRCEIQAKIIMVTSLNTKEKVFEAIRHGADHYILKPFTREKLVQTINECLG
jgi:DNA-binding NarL/FixJ family response regulator